MKMTRLQISNCLGIKSFAFNPGRINIIKGANETGKTSILEIIEKGIRNNSRRVEFVKKGEDQGEIFIELDSGLSIDRKINADGKDPQPKVVKDGFRANAAEGMLKALTGGDQFNPVDFLLKKDKEQAAVILGLMPLKILVQDLLMWFGESVPVDLTKHGLVVLKEIEKYYYNKRKEQNLLVKKSSADIEALFKQLPDNYKADVWREVKLSVIFDKIEKANIVNDQIAKALLKVQEKETNYQAILDSWSVKINALESITNQKIEEIRQKAIAKKSQFDSEISDIDKKIKELMDRKAQVELNITLLSQKEESLIQTETESKSNILNAYVQEQNNDLATFDSMIKQQEDFIAETKPVDVEPLRYKADEAEKMKGFLPIYDNVMTMNKDHGKLEERAKKLDEFVKIAREKPAELLADVEMPIPGLGIDSDGNVTINDLPIKNLSTSTQMKLAVDIAKKTAGELKIINIDKFEHLDPDRQEQFIELIKEDDFQYFITLPTTGELRVETLE